MIRKFFYSVGLIIFSAILMLLPFFNLSFAEQLESIVISVTVDNIPPDSPILDPVESPTNQSTQVISGTKETNTSIWIDGVERIPLGPNTTWSYTVNLNEGANSFNITAKDGVLNESQVVVVNILLDTSSPTMPVVTDDGVFTTLLTQLHASWTSQDPQTDIVEYQYAIGTASGSNDVVDWTFMGIQTEMTHAGLSLAQAQIYYISAKAKNAAGSWSQVGTSDGITVNQSVPLIIRIYPSNASSGYTGDTINFSVDAEDTDGDSLLYQFSLDGQIIQPWQVSSTFSWSTSGVDSGIHSMKVEVSDNNGGVVFQDVEVCLFRKPPGLPL